MPELTDERWEAERRRMVEQQLRGRDIRSEAVLAAMSRVPRHRFVPVEEQSGAYTDYPLPIGFGAGPVSSLSARAAMIANYAPCPAIRPSNASTSRSADSMAPSMPCCNTAVCSPIQCSGPQGERAVSP